MVYSLPQPVGLADLALMRKIDALHLEPPFMGARMLRDQQARQGVRAGRRYIRTLMLRMGIEALAPQSGTSKAAPLATGSPVPAAQAGDQPRQPGLSVGYPYIPMARGFVYLTAVVDVAPRIASWRIRWRSH